MHALLLFKQHGVQNGHDPVLKGTVITVGNQHVTYSVQALGSEVLAPEVEAANIGGCHTLQPHCIASAMRHCCNKQCLLVYIYALTPRHRQIVLRRNTIRKPNTMYRTVYKGGQGTIAFWAA